VLGVPDVQGHSAAHGAETDETYLHVLPLCI
jgi:hypothetical protein